MFVLQWLFGEGEQIKVAMINHDTERMKLERSRSELDKTEKKIELQRIINARDSARMEYDLQIVEYWFCIVITICTVIFALAVRIQHFCVC